MPAVQADAVARREAERFSFGGEGGSEEEEEEEEAEEEARIVSGILCVASLGGECVVAAGAASPLGSGAVVLTVDDLKEGFAFAPCGGFDEPFFLGGGGLAALTRKDGRKEGKAEGNEEEEEYEDDS